MLFLCDWLRDGNVGGISKSAAGVEKLDAIANTIANRVVITSALFPQMPQPLSVHQPSSKNQQRTKGNDFYKTSKKRIEWGRPKIPFFSEDCKYLAVFIIFDAEKAVFTKYRHV